MATDLALQYLESLQVAAAGRLGLELKDYTRDSVKATLLMEARQTARDLSEKNGLSPDQVAEMMRALERDVLDALNYPTSRYQDPLKHQRLVELAGQIQRAGLKLGLRTVAEPVLGTLRTGTINAMSLQFPELASPLILFESELFTFALLMSKAVVQTFPLVSGPRGYTFATDKAAVLSVLSRNPELQARFSEATLAYVLEGAPSSARPYLADPPQARLAQALFDSMELFVMGHEFGHLVDVAPVLPKVELPAGMPGEDVIRNWLLELRADAIGLQLMLMAKDEEAQFDLSLAAWGADFFFSCMDTVEKAKAVLLTGTDEVPMSPTHPPSPIRRAKI